MNLELKTGVLAEPVLVGRERELEELQSLLNSAIEGKGTTVFVSGEAGAGKTRLIREFLNAAKNKGLVVLAGWCLSDAAAPYFPFVEAFHFYFVSSAEEEQPTGFQKPETPPSITETEQLISGERGIAAWLAGPTPLQKIGKTDVVPPQVWKDQVYAGVADTLHSIATQQPIILFLEDIHWADSASLALLHYLARAVDKSERILVIATFRSEELTADIEGHPHPLAETLRMMRREDLFTEIKLPNLNQGNVSKMAENMIGGTLQPKLAEKLMTESRGNPLFVVESLRMLHERRSLVQENNEWRLTVDELGIPLKIKDIILRRLSILKYTQRRVLDAASVIGETFDAELLGTVLGQDNLEVLETLNVIARSTSLVRVEQNLYRFDHARSRETLYEELSLPLKRGYHERIAEKLESTKGSVLPLSDLAFHFAQAGNKEKALKYTLAAAKDELARFSNQQAIQHFTYVLQNIQEGDAEERRMALEGLGDAYTAISMYADAIKTFNALAASQTGAVRLRALRKAMEAAFHKGDKPDLLLEYARKAEELAAYDRLEMARVLNNRGRAFAWAGRGDITLDFADYKAALQVFEEENSVADAGDALWRCGIVGDYEGPPESMLDRLLRSVAIFKDLGDTRKGAEATLYLGMKLFGFRLFPETKASLSYVLKTGEKLGLFAEMAMASYWMSMVEEFEGNPEAALSQTLKGLEYEKKTDAKPFPHALVRLHTRLGNLKKADEYFEKTIKPLPDNISTNSPFLSINLSKGLYFAAKGEWKESDSAFKKYEESLRAFNLPVWESQYRTDYAWALEKQGRLKEARLQRGMAQKLLEQANERVAHANVRLSVMVLRNVEVGEDFEMRLDIVNVGRKPGALVKIAGAIPAEFKVVGLSSFCSLQNGSVVMKDKGIDGFQVETVKLQVNVTKAGSYGLNPEIFYVSDLGETKAFKANPITITAQPAKPVYEVLPGRIATGYAELDALLFGGIPEKYAIALTSPSTDEREQLVSCFLEAGSTVGEATFYITAESGNAKTLAEKYPSNFFLFMCNPQANAMAQDLPNAFKLKGVENLTDINIALTKAFRTLSPTLVGPKRICIEIVSDVLLQHHAINTRRWLSALLPTLKEKGFTILGVIDQQMHASEELQAILGVFEGEIRVTERETPEGVKQTLKIRKLYNQKYLENEINLTKESLSD